MSDDFGSGHPLYDPGYDEFAAPVPAPREETRCADCIGGYTCEALNGDCMKAPLAGTSPETPAVRYLRVGDIAPQIVTIRYAPCGACAPGECWGHEMVLRSSGAVGEAAAQPAQEASPESPPTSESSEEVTDSDVDAGVAAAMRAGAEKVYTPLVRAILEDYAARRASRVETTESEKGLQTSDNAGASLRSAEQLDAEDLALIEGLLRSTAGNMKSNIKRAGWRALADKVSRIHAQLRGKGEVPPPAAPPQSDFGEPSEPVTRYSAICAWDDNEGCYTAQMVGNGAGKWVRYDDFVRTRSGLRREDFHKEPNGN